VKDDGTYKLDELAREAGTSSRTVRYYVQRGLLPAPQFKGRDTVYGDEHLLRLRVIRRLQDEYLPLDAIAAELEGRSRAELERLLDGPVRRAAPSPPRKPARSFEPELTRWKRLTIVPGLEVAIAEDAPEEVHVLAQSFLEMLEAMSNAKEGAK